MTSTTGQRDTLALLFTMTFPSIMSWIEFWVLPGEGSEKNAALSQVFALGKIVQFSFPVVYAWSFARSELRPARPHLRGMGLALGFGLVVVAGTFALYFPFLKHAEIFADTPQKLA